MATARDRAAAGVIDGKLYVVGGDDAHNNTLSSMEVFDPATQQWSAAPPMATARCRTGAGVIDGELYVVGGGDRGNTFSSMEACGPSTE